MAKACQNESKRPWVAGPTLDETWTATNFSSNPLNRFDRDKMIIWIQKKAKQHSKISDTQSNNFAGSDNDDEEDSAIVVDD